MSDNRENNQLLIDRVKNILETTPASDWQQGGQIFQTGLRSEKPKDHWEWAFCIAIPSGMLLFRASTPVKSEFAGRGFTMRAIRPTKYTVELRPSGWRLVDLINPQRVQTVNNEFSLLAENETAHEIFNFVSSRIEVINKDSLARLIALSEDISLKLESDDVINGILWKEIPDEPDITHFNGEYEGVLLDIYRLYSNQGIKFAMKVSDETNVVSIKKPIFISDLFSKIEDQFKTSKLVKLTKVLEEL